MTESIDWTAARRRLDESARSLANALDPKAEDVEEILRRRALSLARREAQAPGDRSPREVLVFRLGAERYALPLADVREVLRLSDPVPVPGAPSAILGVVAVRGEIRPVVDLSRVVGLPLEEGGESRYGLLVGRGPVEVAFAVREVETIEPISHDALAAPGVSDHLDPRFARFLEGVLPGLLPLMSVEALLSKVVKEATSS